MTVTIGRRELLAALGGAVAAWPLAARAQQGERMRRIGVLMGWPESDPEARLERAAFVQELQKLGWLDGRNLRINTRWANPADPESMHRYAKELVALQPDLILSQSTPATAALLQETRTIPVIFGIVARQRLRRELSAPRRQRYRFCRCGADAGRQVDGIAQGDFTPGHPGRRLVQPCNGFVP